MAKTPFLMAPSDMMKELEEDKNGVVWIDGDGNCWMGE